MEELKAMVFAAGLGTRLRPLTNDRPKAMVEVGGMPLLEIQLRRLKQYGFTEVVVNVHHFADLVIAFLGRRDWGLTVHISDERDHLLETGGGLRKAQPLLDGPDSFLVCNVDVLTNLDLHALVAAHRDSGVLATLALRDRETSRYLTWSESLSLTGWENRSTGATRGQPHPEDIRLAFSGIQVIHPNIFQHLQPKGAFSIIDTYVGLAGTGLVQGYRHDADVWLDVGKPPELALAEGILDKIL